MPVTRPSLAPYQSEPVQRLVADAAQRWPRKTAIIDGERTVTFAELDAYADRFAVALVGLGVAKGDFVGILAPNCVEFEIAFFGILKAGATVTTINSSYREREIAAQLNASGAPILVAHHTLMEMTNTAAGDAPALQRTIVIDNTADDPASFWGSSIPPPACRPN